MYKNLYKILYSLKKGTEELNYGREIIVEYVNEFINNNKCKKLKILDLGLGEGTDLLNIKKNNKDIDIELHGLESYKPNVVKALENNIDVKQFNLETSIFPYEDESFDIIIANQVLEHTKEIFWIFSEVSRILKKNGFFIVGVPNLASLHNRVALLLGKQPPAIKVLGPHVRGYTEESFKEFIELDNYFRLIKTRGSNFYPFSPKISKILCKYFKNLAVGKFYLIVRTDKNGLYKEVLKNRFFETPYYTGDVNINK